MTESMVNAPRPTRPDYRRGWKLVTKSGDRMGVRIRLEQLVQSPVASETIKEVASKLLASIENDRLSVSNFNTAYDLIKRNRLLLSKRGVKQLEAKNGAGGHAVFVACQSCENLRDLTVGTHSRQERDEMVAQIASAITVLSELQTQLMGVNNDQN